MYQDLLCQVPDLLIHCRQRYLRKRLIKVNCKACLAKYRVQQDDVISIPEELENINSRKTSIQIKLIHQIIQQFSLNKYLTIIAYTKIKTFL